MPIKADLKLNKQKYLKQVPKYKINSCVFPEVDYNLAGNWNYIDTILEYVLGSSAKLHI